MQATKISRPGRVAMLVAAILLAGCATSAKQEDEIATRAQARWDLLLADDYAAAYEYLSPGYRSSVTSVQYQRKLLLQKVRWNGARYLEHECQEDVCNVRISLDFLLIQAVPGVNRYEGTQTIEEDWIRADGTWWYVPKK